MEKLKNRLCLPEDYLGYDRYTYCLGNPFKYTDPRGEDPIGATRTGSHSNSGLTLGGDNDLLYGYHATIVDNDYGWILGNEREWIYNFGEIDFGSDSQFPSFNGLAEHVGTASGSVTRFGNYEIGNVELSGTGQDEQGPYTVSFHAQWSRFGNDFTYSENTNKEYFNGIPNTVPPNSELPPGYYVENDESSNFANGVAIASSNVIVIDATVNIVGRVAEIGAAAKMLTRVTGGLGIAGGVVGVGFAGYNINSELDQNGGDWNAVSGWLWADLTVSGVSALAGVGMIFLVSNPVGWSICLGIGVGASVYGISRAIYDVNNKGK